MSATILKIRWTDHEITGPHSITSGGDFLSSRIGVVLREQHCPSCNSIIYSRRQSRCGVCEQVLPERLRFSSSEAEKVDVLLRTERQRHKAWVMRIEDGRKARAVSRHDSRRAQRDRKHIMVRVTGRLPSLQGICSTTTPCTGQFTRRGA